MDAEEIEGSAGQQAEDDNSGNQGPQSPETYTREEVDALIAAKAEEAREKGRNEAAAQFRRSRNQEKPRGTGKSGNSELDELRSKLEMMEIERSFDDHMPESMQLSKSQRIFLRNAFTAQRPEDPAEWFAQAASVIAPTTQGSGDQSAARTTQRRRTAEQVQGSPRPAPAPPAELPDTWNPLTATSEELARFKEKHGGDPRATARAMRAAMQKWNAGRNR